MTSFTSPSRSRTAGPAARAGQRGSRRSGTLGAATALLILLLAAPVEAQRLRIDVSHPPDATADVRVALYTSPETWLETPAFAVVTPATDTLTVVRFDALPAGVYGAAAYLDQNRNGELDRNLVGWFTEPFGFSEKARVRFGPPKWKDAVFTVGTGELRLQVRTE